ncbi:hypothetical protein FWK35_00016653 [Aphis craccivora]|uniref:Uncharacterized protein n=1 Tax=Aphis craccivora TaxID=307492 RepID=A0A6G0YBV4_APHCR|nr:hypothetical protein FWK35_00016653 [Aphis craccivora]
MKIKSFQMSINLFGSMKIFENLIHRITYEKLCIKFSSILIGPKKLYRHFKKNFQKN